MKNPSGKAQIAHLAALEESKIDLSDVPERLDWSDAQVGVFYRPIKKSVTVRIDADVLAWFKANSEKYQSRMNQALRAYMQAQRNPR